MMTRGQTRLVWFGIASFILSSFPAMVWAEVGRMTLKELVAGSDLIVVAKVSRVEDGPADTRVEDRRFSAVRLATAEIIETWKGTPVREIRFRASPTWTCDISTAEEGERVVLFLSKPRGETLMTIGHSGRGRMPLREVQGRTYATFWADVELPKGTATIPGPEPEYSFIRSVGLSRLRELVRGKGP